MAVSRAFLRLVDRVCDGDPDPVYTPLVVRGVERPLTVYRSSACHASWLVVYDPGFLAPSRSEWIVPGTYTEDE